VRRRNPSGKENPSLDEIAVTLQFSLRGVQINLGAIYLRL